MTSKQAYSEKIIRDLWSTGEIIKHGKKKYTVHRMSYGDYFLEPASWRGGEKDGFASGTLWMKKVYFDDYHGAYYIENDLLNER